MATKTVWVRAAKGISPSGVDHKVMLFELDERHPNGEAFVAGPDPVEVFETATVAQKLRNGDLEEVASGDVKKFQERKRERAREATRTDDQVEARAKALDLREQELLAREAKLRENEQEFKAKANPEGKTIPEPAAQKEEGESQ